MVQSSPLDDPQNAAHAWGRFRKLMWRMAGVALASVIVAMAALYLIYGPVSIHFFIAIGLGIGGMMLLTGFLMGLVFLSNGTGHDEAIGEAADPAGHGDQAG